MNEIRTREIAFKTDENTISGLPIVFNAMSEVLFDTESKRKFREVIAPEALTQEFIDTQDVLLNVNHDRDKVLARRKNGKGSMDINTREDGVYFKTTVPNTQLGKDTYEQLKRGELFNMSFAFIDGANKGDITWDFNTEDNIPIRTVHKIARLLDISIVYNPAYSQTSVTARSIDEAKEMEEQERALKVKVEVEVEKDDKENECKEVKEVVEVPTAEIPENEINKSEDDRGCCDTEKRENEDYLELLKPYKEIINTI